MRLLTANREQDAQDLGGDVLGSCSLPDSQTHEVVAAESSAHARTPVFSCLHDRSLHWNFGVVHAFTTGDDKVGLVQNPAG